VEKVYAKIPGAKAVDPAHANGQSGLYTIPCDVPEISFAWGRQQWPISASDFSLGRLNAGDADCVGALVGQDITGNNNTWLLGNVFMRNVYTLFDIGSQTVSFAPLSS